MASKKPPLEMDIEGGWPEPPPEGNGPVSGEAIKAQKQAEKKRKLQKRRAKVKGKQNG